MRAKDGYLKALTRHALKNLGVDPDIERVWTGQASGAQYSAIVQLLPATGTGTSLVDSAGAFIFMADLDGLDSGQPLG